MPCANYLSNNSFKCRKNPLVDAHSEAQMASSNQHRWVLNESKISSFWNTGTRNLIYEESGPMVEILGRKKYDSVKDLIRCLPLCEARVKGHGARYKILLINVTGYSLTFYVRVRSPPASLPPPCLQTQPLKQAN